MRAQQEATRTRIRESLQKERQREQEDLEAAFQTRVRMRFVEKRLLSELAKAQRACEKLDREQVGGGGVQACGC